MSWFRLWLLKVAARVARETTSSSWCRNLEKVARAFVWACFVSREYSIILAKAEGQLRYRRGFYTSSFTRFDLHSMIYSFPWSILNLVASSMF